MANKLPSGLTYEHHKEDTELGEQHTLVARHPDAKSEGWGVRGKMKGWKNRAGHMSWYGDGEIGGVEVHPDHQRKGIATELHRRAKEITPHLHHSEDLTPDGAAWSKTVARKIVDKLAYGETRAPADVDTLRDPNCPVCGDDTFDGAECAVCGFVQPPAFLQDPDLDKAQQLDLRKQIGEEDPNALQKEPGQPNDVANPEDVNDDGTVTGQEQAPGTLPGEVQAEVQTPLNGPEGAPIGNDVPTGPDGLPVGPQELPASAKDPQGQPFTQGPNYPEGPGGPEDPGGDQEQGMQPGFSSDDGSQGQQTMENDQAQEGLTCSNCGFQAEASPPDSMDLQNPDAGSDGTAAGDVCPYCGQGQLMSGSEMGGTDPAPVVSM